MVKLDDEFSISANSNCYILNRKTIVQDKDSVNYGKESLVNEGFFTSIESAIKGMLKIKIREYLSKSTENSIQELQEYIKSLKEAVEKLNLNI